MRDADRLRDLASEFLLLSRLGLRDRPPADFVLFREALGSVGRSAEENRVKWVQVQVQVQNMALHLFAQTATGAEPGLGANDKSKPRKSNNILNYCVEMFYVSLIVICEGRSGVFSQ